MFDLLKSKVYPVRDCDRRSGLPLTGFTLVEMLVAVSIFAVLSFAMYQGYAEILATTKVLRTRTVATNLANEQFEIARNLPYEDIGTVGGVPAGVLQQSQIITREGIDFTVTTTVRNIDLPFDGTIGGIPDDLSPADNKMLEIEIACDTCESFQGLKFNTNIAPESLESLSSNGALRINVFDADGMALPLADIRITNDEVSPSVDITDVSGNNGILTIVDALPSVEGYQITVTKDGYTTDQTYTADGVNPNPTKPHATVSQGLVTSVSFAIDELSAIDFESVTHTCSPVGSVDFDLVSDALIGTSPDVLKYQESQITDGSGSLELASLEWGTYIITPTDTSFDVVGILPAHPVTLAPGDTQSVQLVMRPSSSSAWVLSVVDDNTDTAIEDATVRIQGTGVDETRITHEATITQTDWSGGAGQVDFVNTMQYWEDDGNVYVGTAGEVQLTESVGVHASSGTLTSSTMDFGGATVFETLSWSETTPTGTDVRFQVASSSSGTPTDFIGPDGTNATFYTATSSGLHASHDGDRYLRYKIFLSTTDTLQTPSVDDVAVEFAGPCVPPGQVFFQSIGTGTYTVTVDAAGYDTLVSEIDFADDWQFNEIRMEQS